MQYLAMLRNLKPWDWVKLVFYVAAVIFLPDLQQHYAQQMTPEMTQGLQAVIALIAAHDTAIPNAKTTQG